MKISDLLQLTIFVVIRLRRLRILDPLHMDDFGFSPAKFSLCMTYEPCSYITSVA